MRLALIRHKNETYHRLCEAARACDRRRHMAGCVPSTWLERLAVLEAEYRDALAALGIGCKN